MAWRAVAIAQLMPGPGCARDPAAPAKQILHTLRANTSNVLAKVVLGSFEGPIHTKSR